MSDEASRLAKVSLEMRCHLDIINTVGEKMDDQEAEIERLRDSIDKWRKRGDGFLTDIHEKMEHIEELKQHLKRAIAPVDVGGGSDGIHIITDEQIAAAWGWVYHDGRPTLEKLGFVDCPKCYECEEYSDDCPACHGHGWVKK